MAHDATVVLMGSIQSSIKEVSNVPGVIAAGLKVHSKSDGTFTVAKADGAAVGISVGRNLSNTSRSAVCRKGVGVPVVLTNGFTPTKGAQVAISDTTGKAMAYTGSGDSYVNAYYASSTLTGIDEDGNNLADGCALIDFPGGL